jgi:tRNA-2-methylthio-N6-dimethylallyladenosine synthase
VAVTSDFIVGFCGETEEDYQQSVELLRASRFKNSFIFKYSPRPGTKGYELYADDVPEEVKRRRNNELLAVQNAISEEDNQPFVGRTVEVLVEGPSKAARKHEDSERNSHTLQLTGRTMCDRIVVFEGTRRQIGETLPITIDAANAFTLFGSVVTQHAGPEVYAIELNGVQRALADA